MQNTWAIIGEIAHCAVVAGGRFRRPFRRPVEGPFADCSVFAVTCALFAGSNALTLWRRGARRYIFTDREGGISIPAGVLYAESRSQDAQLHSFPYKTPAKLNILGP